MYAGGLGLVRIKVTLVRTGPELTSPRESSAVLEVRLLSAREDQKHRVKST